MVTVPGREDVRQSLEAAGCEVVLGRSLTDNWAYSEDELVEKVKEMDALMASTGELMTRRVMEAAVKVQTIAKLGIGVEQIDIEAATELGILVTNTPIEENVFSVAEFAVATILALAKQLKLADRNARLGSWRSITHTFLRGKTVGIVGLGRVGSRVAQLLSPFQVRLLGCDPYVAVEKAQALGVELTDLESLLRESDFVTLHTSVTAETRGLVGEAQLKMMKPTAYLVNTGRGALVDEGALAKALEEGWIAGAALDVFEPEIPAPDNPLLRESLYLKTIFSPHIAGRTLECMWQLPLAQLENCFTALRGEVPKYVVNPAVIPEWRERRSRLSQERLRLSA